MTLEMTEYCLPRLDWKVCGVAVPSKQDKIPNNCRQSQVLIQLRVFKWNQKDCDFATLELQMVCERERVFMRECVQIGLG